LDSIVKVGQAEAWLQPAMDCSITIKQSNPIITVSLPGA
jgi:hypothetical protein